MDGRILVTFRGDRRDGDVFGSSVSGAGDVNGDGNTDLIVGAYFDDINGPDSGSARVCSGHDALGANYCGPAVPNSSGAPGEIEAWGSEMAADNALHLTASSMPASELGYFLASETQNFIPNPGGSQGTLCLGGQIARFRHQMQDSGAAGSFSIQVDLTNIPMRPPQQVLIGERWNFQAWFRDGNSSNFTDGVSVLFR